MTMRRVLTYGLLLIASSQLTNSGAQPRAKVQSMPDAVKSAAWKAYGGQLASMCPRQKLQLLSPAAMNLKVQFYEAHELTPMQNQQFQEAAALACLNVAKGGAGCANTGMLVAAQQGRYLDRFAHYMCGTGFRCTTQNACREK